MADPFLHVDAAGPDARAAVLVLHGGRVADTTPTRATQLAVLRMTPFVRSLRRAGSPSGLVVAHLRYRVGGWNGTAQSPVADVTWALDRLAERTGGLPVALVGHSMGGRAALYAAGHPSVHAVAGLAPWIEEGDPNTQLAGRRLLVMHGDADRITDPRRSARYVEAAARVADTATYVSVRHERHAMLRRAALWHGVATGWVLATVCAVPPADLAAGIGSRAAAVVTRTLAGITPLTV